MIFTPSLLQLYTKTKQDDEGGPALAGQRPGDGLGHGRVVLEQPEESQNVARGGTDGEEGLCSVSWRTSGGDREGLSERDRE